MNLPKELRYTKTHEWTKKDGNKMTVGISDYAQKEISDVVFVEVPKVGASCQQEKAIAVVESVKAASDIYAPVAGEIVEVNSAVESSPELINTDAFGEGWIFKIKPASPGDPGGLLDAGAYKTLIG